MARDLAVAGAGEIRAPLGGADGAPRLILPAIPADDGAATVPPFKTTPAGLATVGGDRDERPAWRSTEDVIDGSVTVTFERVRRDDHAGRPDEPVLPASGSR